MKKNTSKKFKFAINCFLLLSLTVNNIPIVLAEKFITGVNSGQGSALNEPTIIGLGADQVESGDYSKLQHAYQFIAKKILPNSSKFLLYPENFSYQHGSSTQFFGGAVFDLKPEKLSELGASAFAFLKSSTTIDIGRARALYDGSMAILDISKITNGQNRHLTYESEAYCHILHTYLAKHEQCFHGFADFQAYQNDSNVPNKEVSSLVMLNAADIQGGKLLNANNPFFKILILPDITSGLEGVTIAELGSSGLAAISDFVNKGGVVISSGKSSLLLEQAGILAINSVEQQILIKHKQNKGRLLFTNGVDFESHLLQLGQVPENGYFNTYFLSSFFVRPEVDPDLIDIANLDLLGDSNYYFQDRTSLRATSTPVGQALALGYKKFGQGGAYILAGQPASGAEKYYPYVLDAVFGAMSKDIIANLKVVQKTNPALDETVIPALESNVILNGELKLVNYFNQPIHNVLASVNVAKGISVDDQESLPSGCILTNLNNQFYSSKIDCTQSALAGFASTTYDFKFKIVDAAITQKKWGILAAAAKITYLRSSGEAEELQTGGSYLTAYRGAEIRSEYNPDPSSFYPLKGEGVYIDNVLTAENKEDTNANEVEHVAVVPLISPVVDGNNQGSLAYTLEFADNYYQARKTANSFVFPFINSLEGQRDHDYIDYQSLKCSDVTLSADWDTPVKTILMNRSAAGLPAATGCQGQSIEQIIGKDYAYTVNSESLAAKQLYFADASNYYEQATQRQLVYIDTTKPNGAASYYGGNIPVDLQKGLVAKKNLIFARNDVYFYPNKNYPLPEGITDKNAYLTIDRFASSTCGNAKGILTAGYFNDTKAGGIKANEYDNALQCKNNKTKIDYSQIENYSGGKIKVSHYLFPVASEDQIGEASDLAYFSTTTGEYKNYPEVKFIKAHSVDFLLDQSSNPKGGRFTFILPNGVNFSADPIASGLITLSADHVAVRKINFEASTSKIRVDFIRGKMPDQTNGKPDVLRLNLEGLNTDKPITITAGLEKLDYDIGRPGDMTVYTSAVFVDNLELTKKPFLSLPSLVMKFRLKRGAQSDQSYFQKYEYFEPFVRYGVYIQELAAHRTVYGYAENHPVSDPGLVLSNGGFSTFSNIGASSIPFREYLQTGIKQVIPSSQETARVDYQDIWKRQWSTPIRTVMPDVPPIPPPLRNFMMNTTFEVRDKASGARQLEWASDRKAEVLYKVKVLNNYPKYFEPTVCKANEVLLNANLANGLSSKYFVLPVSNFFASTTVANAYLHRSNIATYGVCYQSQGDLVSNQLLTPIQRDEIKTASTCEHENNCPVISSTTPTISRRPSGEVGNWNYSQAVADYYPTGYITEPMWSLTHYDYDDSAFSKGYSYHMDNLLPNMDNVRNGLLRPHNIVAQPIYKGLGYSLSYNPNYQSQLYNVDGQLITGWMSDNLQNKDDTLLVGQASINSISIDKSSLLGTQMVRIDQMDQTYPQAAAAMNNIYACLFNRSRAKVDPVNSKIVYPNNVYVNNVVPIAPDLEKNDARLTEYNCGNLLYDPATIHEFNNVVKTDAKDWLYFGVGLRGGAKETINIVSELNPISGVNFEGFAKINDGGRFTYWNPANGPNSFLVLDNVVNVIEAMQSNITMNKEIIPVEVPTFNSDIYHLITIADQVETDREFTESPYLKNYGFGDAVTSIQVGVANNLKANGSILEPGDTTTVKLELFNNSGYDWNLIKSTDGQMAIESIDLPAEAISANDLLSKTKHAIKQPTSFNFLNFAIPLEISDYVQIMPSTHNVGTPGILFDFDNINVTTIRDGYKGTYAIDLKVSSDLPASLRGKTYDINVSLVPKFFDKYPGHPHDPVSHDYQLNLPSIRFGVPYATDQGSRAGKVFRTSGYSHNIAVIDEMPNGVDPLTVKRISWSELQNFRAAANNPVLRQSNLKNLYSRNDFGEAYSFSTTSLENGNQKINLSLADNGISEFPIPQISGPDTAVLYLLVRSHSVYLPYGDNKVNQNLKSDYTDSFSFTKSARMSDPQYRIVRAAGANLETNYSAEIIGKSTGEKLSTQKLSPHEENFVRLKVRLENVGSAIAYQPKASIFLPNAIMIATTGAEELINHATTTEVRFSLSDDLAPGDVQLLDLIVNYNKNNDNVGLKFINVSQAAANEIEIVDHAAAQFDLTSTPGENQVDQKTAGAFYMPLATDNQPQLTITAKKLETNLFSITLLPLNSTSSFYKLFLKDVATSTFSEVGLDYDQNGSYKIKITKGGSQFYGVLYDRVLVVNNFGEEVYQYFKLAESGTLLINYDSDFSININIDMYKPPRPPVGTEGQVEKFAIQVINRAGEKISKTYDQIIRLKLIGGPDVSKVAISEFSNFKNASLEAYHETIDWLLSSGQGIKTLYAKFYTRFGVSSPVTTVKIQSMNDSVVPKKIQGVKIINQEVGLTLEAQALINSQENKKIYLNTLGVKRSLMSERYGLKKYIRNFGLKMTEKTQINTLNTFIIYGTKSSQKISWNKRYYLLKSYEAIYGRLPDSTQDWFDVLRIANGLTPDHLIKGRNIWAEKRYEQVYKMRPKNDQKSREQLNIIAYGLSNSADNDQILQKEALAKYQTVYKDGPRNQNDWNLVRSIAMALK
ncbi:MAG: hypothetical protein WCG01_02175 [bacterium]